jgi:outer membrane protein assembly factor BamB
VVAALLLTGVAAADAQPAPPPSPPPSPPQTKAPKPRQAGRPGPAGPQAPLDRQVFPFYPLQTSWTNIVGLQPSAPAATDGVRIFIPFTTGDLNVWKVAGGAHAFAVRFAGTLAPVVDDGRLFLTTERLLEAVQSADGAPLWKTQLAAPAARVPVARGGWVFVALTDGAVTALRADTGTAVWTVPVGAPSTAPVVEGDRLYVPDGKTVWRVALDSDVTAITAVAGVVFAATTGRWLYALDAGKGQVRWRFRIQGAAIGLVVDDDRVVAVMLDQSVRAFKIGSGAQAWRQELSFRPAGGPVIMGQSVLVTGFGPTMRALDRKTGGNQGLYALPLPADASGISLETLSTGPLTALGPTLFDDVVMLVTQHGFIHAARRAFDPPATAVTALPGTLVPVPAPPEGWVEPTPPATPVEGTPSTTPTTTTTPPTTPPTAPATTPAATPPSQPPAGTPPRTPPAPPAR